MSSFNLTRLHVENFRNLPKQVISFKKGINYIFGDNGNGKTNILEAIYVLLMGQSFRKNARFEQMLGLDADRPEIVISGLVEFEHVGKIENYSISLTQKEKKRFLGKDQLRENRQLGAITVCPQDFYLFFSTASFKRKWFFHSFSLFSSQYKFLQKQHDKILKMRNKLLKNRGPSYQQELKIVDEHLVQRTVELIQSRMALVEEVNARIDGVFKELFSENFHLRVYYRSNFSLDPAEIKSKLESTYSYDLLVKHTSCHANNDDFVFLMNGLEASHYASIGQQKMVYLGLIFAFLHLYEEYNEFFPIVLIDDISGEFDGGRICNLMNYLEKNCVQTLITTASVGLVDKAKKGTHFLCVKDGYVK